jgi:hypothetical protein
MYWVCYQVLRASGDEDHAADILRSAYALVQAQAASISEETLRLSFLAQVKVNRAIMAAMARAS